MYIIRYRLTIDYNYIYIYIYIYDTIRTFVRLRYDYLVLNVTRWWTSTSNQMDPCPKILKWSIWPSVWRQTMENISNPEIQNCESPKNKTSFFDDFTKNEESITDIFRKKKWKFQFGGCSRKNDCRACEDYSRSFTTIKKCWKCQNKCWWHFW